MRIFVRERLGYLPNTYPSAVLVRNNWDDFGYKTLFAVRVYTRSNDFSEIGNVKILELAQRSGYTELPEVFSKLGEDYCSLGQDSEYYEAVQALPSGVRMEYLNALRDAAYDPQVRRQFRHHPGWQTSLLRFGQAENALDAGERLFQGTSKQRGALSFTFTNERDDRFIQVPFAFDDTGPLPGRCHVMIGYNGVGKTTLLADLAVAASRVGLKTTDEFDAEISGEDTTFGAVVAVSYSAFDTFVTPFSDSDSGGSTETFGYVYCGLRKFENDADQDASRLKSIPEIELEFADALDQAGARGEERNHLATAFSILNREPSFGRAGVDLERLWQGGGALAARADFRILSTGHKIVLNIVTQLAAHLKRRSLVLLDEPETHLHPPLMAALLKAVQALLDAHDSFAIIATHSPVVVQEIPGRFVRIIERVGDDTDIEEAAIETYGEAIGLITRHVFSLDSSATDFQGVLKELADTMSIEQIEGLFEEGLSTQARALVLNYKHEAGR